ncbi:glutathione S-transferase [Microvirga tunisiensis]|uniref:Glutathione S-transferase n=2 Tax=Pannonibacter tanglangensis TaxID=2750084 RepID=A0ABW9ZKS5_9HYPH|nr:MULTISPECIES: glutathione S-transferase family protein [unclassified Pannonibacter]NBN64522.1 glutathione S-transferase [Pannonibacter sp. XCT-34]NBN79056.1 glutathione S-transferase [Pannonibacter sp. XCT-53]
MRLYIGNKNYSSWSLRPWVLMRVLDIPFEERLVPFRSAEWQAVEELSPTGRVPCLVDGERLVWDSLAITEYLAEIRSEVWPADRTARAFARSVAAEMHSGFQALRAMCSMNCGLKVRLSAVTPAVARDWARIDALWQDGLSRFGGPFLAGTGFTAADAFYAPVAFRARTYAPDLSPASSAYVARLLDLPAMQDWFRAALAEPWRDAPHEAEILAAGTILEDLRQAG